MNDNNKSNCILISFSADTWTMHCQLSRNMFEFTFFGLSIGYLNSWNNIYARVAWCILLTDCARTVGRPYFKTYHLTWTSRTTTGACITGKYMSSFRIHNDPVKYFMRDLESIVVVEVNFKSSEKFTVAYNHFYTLRHTIPSILSFYRELFWLFSIDENIRFAINLMNNLCAIIEIIILLVINDT